MRATTGKPSHPVFVALRETIVAKDIPEAAVRRSAESLPPGSNRQALSDTGTRSSTIASIPRIRSGAWSSISAATATQQRQRLIRRHLHRASTGEFLARRVARPRKRPHLHPARCRRGSRSQRSRHCRTPLRRSTTFALMKDLIARTRVSIRRRHAAGKDGRRPPERRSGNVQPRRSGGAGCDRSAKATTPCIIARRSAKASKRVCSAARCWRIWRQRFSPKGRSSCAQAPTDRSSPDAKFFVRRIAGSYEACHDIAKAARSNFYYAFLPAAETQARRIGRAVRLHAPDRRRRRRGR